MTDHVRISPRAMKSLAQQLDATGSSIAKAARIAVPAEIYALPYVDDSLAHIARVARGVGRDAESMATNIDAFLHEAEALDGLVSDRFIEKGWQQ